MPKKKTTAEFIVRAKQVHGDKYDYSKAVYQGIHTKICIICPKHGEFWQEPNNHISQKTICPECAKEKRADYFRSSTKEFIEKAQKVHNYKYDYSKVDYRSIEEKVCIICPEHGAFWQSPHNHLNGAGCPTCAGNRVPTTEDYLKQVKAKYGDRYDYSKVVYRGVREKVCVICPEHGEFWVSARNFLRQNGCPKCSGNYGIDKEYFIKTAIQRFNNKYDYTKVQWNGYKRRVCIICPEHGETWQTPYSHLRTQGCPVCSGRFLNGNLFIEKARAKHKDKYDYSKVNYIDSKTPICIICPEHGEFWQKPNDHLMGHGCRKCYEDATRIRLTKSVENFLTIAQEVHKGKYDYSLVEYVDRRTPVKILCPKHGPFMQTPKSHIRGAGCPLCNNSYLEETVSRMLTQNHIPFIAQKTFEWLTYNGTLHIDFFLYEHNIAIECQGLQHFKPVEFWGGKEGLANTKKRDSVKKQLLERRGIKMLYYSNLGIKYPYDVIEDINILLKLIKEGNGSDTPLWKPDPELPFEF